MLISIGGALGSEFPGELYTVGSDVRGLCMLEIEQSIMDAHEESGFI
jgi:hypothetical protein